MIYCGIVYDELLHQCQIAIKPPATSAPPTPTEDTDNVYYRFGGAAIAAMLELGYDKMQSSNCANKDQISLEIAILQKISVHLEEDKSNIPAYLKYRDEGFMYFPIPELLPMLKAVDIKTKELASNDSFTDLGSDLLKKVADSLEKSDEILIMFTGILIAKVPEIITMPSLTESLQSLFESCLIQEFRSSLMSISNLYYQRKELQHQEKLILETLCWGIT